MKADRPRPAPGAYHAAMADDTPDEFPLLQKAGAVITLLGALALAWVAIDTLRPHRDTPADDRDG
jgi:hypothetical protein